MSQRGGDDVTEVIVPIKRRTRDPTPMTDVVQAKTPEPIGSREDNRKPRTVDDVVDRRSPSNVNRYRKQGSPGHSAGQVRGLIIPWSREVDYDRRDIAAQYPRQRLAPISPCNRTNATRTISRDMDLYEPPVWDYSKNPLRDRYPYDDENEHHPYDLPSGHYPYFSFPEEEKPKKRRVPLIRLKPPRRRAGSDPGGVETAVWVFKHGQPTRPDVWGFRIDHDPVLNRDYLESPLGKRRYIGHVPRVTDRDRWERQYWDYLVQMEKDSDIMDDRKQHRGYYNSDLDPPLYETSAWIRKNYGTQPDYTDHRNWFQREKDLYRQKERERHFRVDRDYLLTRGSLAAMEGSDVGPEWYMSENERRKFHHDRDIARRVAYKDRVRHRDDGSHFTSVSQRAGRLERDRRGWWTPPNVRQESPHTNHIGNWQVNDNWRYKKPRANPKYPDVANWVKDRR